MLYDPKWETKIDPLSLESLIAWLEKQPANAIYCATNSGRCLIWQWLRSIDPLSCQGNGDSFMYFVNGHTSDFNHLREIVFGGLYTFGAALERAHAASSGL